MTPERPQAPAHEREPSRAAADGDDAAAAGRERWIRADLHTHTRHSLDAFPAPADLVRRAAELGLDRVAVTDHGTVAGALEAKELDPGRVIVGEEIRCACRTEVIGLFLTRHVPDGLELEAAVERIREQGGVVYVPHPFAYVVSPRERARRALALADVVEVINARAFLPFWNRRARRAAGRRELPAGAGSDAHRLRELGRAHVRLPAFADADGFLEAVARAEPELAHATGPWGHAASVVWKAARTVAGAAAGLLAPGEGGAEAGPDGWRGPRPDERRRGRRDERRSAYRWPPLGGPARG